jgi:hypothetical protein
MGSEHRGSAATDRRGAPLRKYLDVWEVLCRRDKELGQAFDGLRWSKAFYQLASMKGLGLLTEEELSRFSQQTQEAVELSLES